MWLLLLLLLLLQLLVVFTLMAQLAYLKVWDCQKKRQMHIGCWMFRMLPRDAENAKCFGTGKVEARNKKFLICCMENFNRNARVGKLSQTFQIDISNIRFVFLFLFIVVPCIFLSLSFSVTVSFYLPPHVCLILCKHFDCHMPIACWNACRNLSWKLFPLTVTNANVKLLPIHPPKAHIYSARGGSTSCFLSWHDRCLQYRKE